MATGYYLIDFPPVRAQSRSPRRQRESGTVVVHSAENTPDVVATDGGSLAVAKFIRNRGDAGSYHVVADSDDYLPLLPHTHEAYQDGTGTNPHAYSISAATRHDFWPLAPHEWRAGCIHNMARAAADYALNLYRRTGIIIPARRITRAESTAGIPGFITHAERDPARRKDPGFRASEWELFFTYYRTLTGTIIPTPPPEDDVPDHNQIEAAKTETVVNWYRGFLNRDPDPDGMKYWLGRLDAADAPKVRAELIALVPIALLDAAARAELDAMARGDAPGQ